MADKRSDNPSPADGYEPDPLDELLLQARWPEPSADADARLRQAWAQAWQQRAPLPAPPRQPRPLIWWSSVAAIAATIAIACALVWLVHRLSQSHPQWTDTRRTQPVVPPPFADTTSRQAPLPLVGREPTVRERLFLSSLNALAAPTYADDPRRARQALADVLNRLVVDPTSDVPALVAHLRDTYSPAALQQALDSVVLTALRDDPGQTPAVARLIAELGGPRHVPALRALMQQPESRDAAITGMCRFADVSALASLAHKEFPAQIHRQFLVALLDRHDPSALNLFLPFVEDPQSRPDALAAVAASEHPPVAALFDVLLQDGRVDRRLAAARTLGAIDSPDVIARLSEILAADPDTREAVAVLLCSPQPTAAAKLALARQSPALWAIVHSVKSQLAIEP